MLPRRDPCSSVFVSGRSTNTFSSVVAKAFHEYSVVPRRSAPPQGPLDLPLHRGLLHRLSFVVELLAAANPQQHLGLTLLEVQLEGHQGEPLLIGFAGELADLAAVQEQLARPLGLVVVAA